MKTVILILISILPIILLATYVYKKDRNKEPKKLLIKLFIAGTISIVLTLIFSFILFLFFPRLLNEPTELSSIDLIFYTFIGISFIEEFSKWIMTYLISYNDENFDEIYDMIIYATFVALGFACFENIIYVLEGGIVTGIIRGLISVPGHACDGVVMGYYLGLAKQNQINNDKNKQIKNIALSLIVPVLFHGIFDYCLLTQNILFLLIFIFFVIFIYINAYKKIKNFSSITTKIKYKNNYCPKCGYKVTNPFCPKCGNKNE